MNLQSSMRCAHLLLRDDDHPLRQFEMSIHRSSILCRNALRHDFIQEFKRIAILHYSCESIVTKIRGMLRSLIAGISVKISQRRALPQAEHLQGHVVHEAVARANNCSHAFVGQLQIP